MHLSQLICHPSKPLKMPVGLSRFFVGQAVVILCLTSSFREARQTPVKHVYSTCLDNRWFSLRIHCVASAGATSELLAPIPGTAKGMLGSSTDDRNPDSPLESPASWSTMAAHKVVTH